MIRASKLLPAEEAGPPSLTVRLGFDDRFRRRLAVQSVEGERILFDLAEVTRLRGGDRLALDDGRVLAIEAEPEDVADISAPDAATLTRLAWHLGNRHTPTAVLGETAAHPSRSCAGGDGGASRRQRPRDPGAVRP